MAPPGVRAAQAARRVALRQQDPEAAERAEVALLLALLGAQFGSAEADMEQDTITLQVGFQIQQFGPIGSFLSLESCA